MDGACSSTLNPVGRRLNRPFWPLLIVIALTACNRHDRPDAGGAGGSAETGRSGAQQTPYSQSAPDAQPRYGQTGDAVASRVITNAEGQTGISIAETNAPGTKPGAPPASDSNAALAQKVKVALSTGTTGTTGTYATDTLLDIGVTADHGLITLTGTVGSVSAKEALGQRARSLQGVRDVNNQLRVAPNAPNSMPGAPAGRGQADVIPQQK